MIKIDRAACACHMRQEWVQWVSNDTLKNKNGFTNVFEQ